MLVCVKSDVFSTPHYLAALDPKHNSVRLAGLPVCFLTSPGKLVHQSLKCPEGQHNGGEKEAENQLICDGLYKKKKTSFNMDRFSHFTLIVAA